MKTRATAILIFVSIHLLIAGYSYADSSPLTPSEIYQRMLTAINNDNAEIQLTEEFVNLMNNARDERGNSVLHLACEANNVEMVHLLLKAGISADLRNTDDVRPVHIAACTGNTDILRELLDYNAFINAKTNDKETALIIAAMNNHVEFVKQLLVNDIKVDAKDNKGMTALLHAVLNGHNTIVNTLIEHGADLKIAGKDGKNAFHYCALSGNALIAKTLVSQPKFKLKTHEAQYGGDKIVFDGLQDRVPNNADINERDKHGYTPLHYAIDVNNLSIVRLFIAYGADVNKKTKSGQTPLGLAIDNSQDSIAGVIWANGGKR